MNDNNARWMATVIYRTASGENSVPHDIEEIEDLQSIVERGPHWDAIIRIEIIKNPSCTTSIDLTVEKAERL